MNKDLYFHIWVAESSAAKTDAEKIVVLSQIIDDLLDVARHVIKVADKASQESEEPTGLLFSAKFLLAGAVGEAWTRKYFLPQKESANE